MHCFVLIWFVQDKVFIGVEHSCLTGLQESVVHKILLSEHQRSSGRYWQHFMNFKLKCPSYFVEVITWTASSLGYGKLNYKLWFLVLNMQSSRDPVRTASKHGKQAEWIWLFIPSISLGKWKLKLKHVMHMQTKKGRLCYIHGDEARNMLGFANLYSVTFGNWAIV